MKTAVVILNWNGKKLLEKFLQNVVDCSAHAEIVVADNASTDDSLTYLKENFPLVRVIAFSENHGFAGGYNKALQQMKSSYYVLLNSDVEVTANWIEPVINIMDEHLIIAACQPKIKSYYKKDFFEYAGAAGGYIDKWGYPFCRGRLFATVEKDKAQYDDEKEIFWASGACMFIRSEVFHNSGGFDEDFFAHMEETDLCWRMQNSGYKIYYVPQSVVYHVGGGTLSKNSPGKTYLNFRNNLMMLHKNLPASELKFVFTVRLILDGIAGIKFLAEAGWADFAAVIRAHFYFYRNLKRRRSVRNKCQALVINHNKKNIYHRSIVIDYFIKKKKYFSGLKLTDLHKESEITSLNIE